MDNPKKEKEKMDSNPNEMNCFKKLNSAGLSLVKISGYRDWHKTINETWIVHDVFLARKKSWPLILDVGLCDGEDEILYQRF